MNDFTDRVDREYNIEVDCANQAGEYIDELEYLVSENISRSTAYIVVTSEHFISRKSIIS